MSERKIKAIASVIGTTLSEEQAVEVELRTREMTLYAIILFGKGRLQEQVRRDLMTRFGVASDAAGLAISQARYEMSRELRRLKRAAAERHLVMLITLYADKKTPASAKVKLLDQYAKVFDLYKPMKIETNGVPVAFPSIQERKAAAAAMLREMLSEKDPSSDPVVDQISSGFNSKDPLNGNGTSRS
jgi:hypothetical protein